MNEEHGGEIRAARKRPGREAEEQTERRRRAGADAHRQRLFLDPSKLDQGLHYRWITSDPARVYALTQQDDYNIVSAEDVGGVRTEHALRGGDGEGRPLGQVLVAKRKDWYDADQKEKQDALKRRMEGVKLGESVLTDGESAGPARAYKPNIDNQVG